MVWRALAKGFLGGVGRTYGTGFINRLTKRYGGRRRSLFKGRRVMRGRYSRRRVARGTWRKETFSQITVNYTTATAVVHASTPAVAIHLTDIDQGDQDFNRTGAAIVITKLKGKFFFNWKSTEVTQLVSGVRVIVSYHPNRLSGSTVPLLADMLRELGIPMVSQYFRKRDVEGNEEFKIVYDRSFWLHKYPSNATDALSSFGANHHLIRINLKPKTRATYSGSAGTSLGAGMYFLWLMTAESMTNDIEVTGQLRTWWRDV